MNKNLKAIATKTLIASTITSLMAGAAFAADETTPTNKVIGEESAVINFEGTAFDKDEVLANSAFIQKNAEAWTVLDVTGKYGEAAKATFSAQTKDGALTLENGSFSGFTGTWTKNTNASLAGLVQVSDGQTAKISNVTFLNNKFGEIKDKDGAKTADGARGIVRFANSDGSIESTRFEGNEAAVGGALNIWNGTSNKHTVTVKNTDFVKNSSGSHGGAVYLSGATLDISDSTFSGNTAALQGGALQIIGASNADTVVTADNVVFDGNSSTQDNESGNAHIGGAVMVSGINGKEVSFTGTDVVFSNNTALTADGGAVAVVKGGEFNLNGGSFTGNKSAGGGAVAIYTGTATFTDVDFRNNQSTGWGGAVMVDAEQNQTSTVTFAADKKDVVIAGNTSADEDTYTGKLYKGHTGGFLHLKGGNQAGTVTANFDTAEGRTITIGEAGSASTLNLDSISSVDSTATINKTGEGKLVINSNTQAFTGTFNVNGGTVEMATGIGECNKNVQSQAAKFNVNNGASATIASVTGSTGSTKYTVDNGELTIDNLHFTKDHKLSFVNNEVLTIGSVAIDKDATLAASTIDNAKGELYTSWKNLFTADEKAESGYVKSAFMNAISGGMIVETEYTGGYDLADLKSLNTDAQKFAFENATLNNQEDGSHWTLSDVEGLYVNATVDNKTAAAEVQKETGVTVLNFVLEDAADVTLTATASAENEAGLDIVGDAAGNLITGVAADKTITFTTKASGNKEAYIALGDDGRTTHLSNSAVVEGQVEVYGNFTAQKDVTIGTNGNLIVDEDARMVAAEGVTMNAGVLSVDGILSTKFIDSSVTNATDSGLNVSGMLFVTGIKPKTGKVTPTDPQPFDNAFDGSMIDQAFDSTHGLIAFAENENAARADVEAYFGEDLSQHKVLYLAGQTNTEAGLWINGNVTDQRNADTLMVNLGATAARTGFDAEDGVINGELTFNGESSLIFTNLSTASTVLDENGVRYVKLAASIENKASNDLSLDLGSQYYVDDVTTAIDAQNGRVYFNVDKERVDRNLGEFWGADTFTQYLADVNVDANRLISQLARAEFDGEKFDREYAEANEIEDLTNLPADAQAAYAKAKAAAEAAFYNRLANEASTVANMAAAGGVYNVMLDALEQNAKVLNRRMTVANSIVRAESGVTPWVDVFGTWNTADRLYGSSGYEADVYGAAFGADWTAPCGAIVGAAVTIGTGDANSVDAATKVDNDVDFYGFSVYGAHQIGNFNGKIDFGYMRTENDLTSSVMGVRYDEDLDADAFTFGIGGEYLLNAGGFNVVPHVGLRYTHLTVDDLSIDVSNESMNVFQMPVGVTVSGTIETAGIKVAPMFDLSFVPAFGDKDAVAKFGADEEVTRVVDTTPIQATLGINAQVDAWTFGVNYELGVGGDERLNNSFNLNARYTF